MKALFLSPCKVVGTLSLWNEEKSEEGNVLLEYNAGIVSPALKSCVCTALNSLWHSIFKAKPQYLSFTLFTTFYCELLYKSLFGRMLTLSYCNMWIEFWMDNSLQTICSLIRFTNVQEIQWEFSKWWVSRVLCFCLVFTGSNSPTF